MEKALFGLTILGMKNEDEDVAKLAVEFWSTVCEEEINIEEDNAQVGEFDVCITNDGGEWDCDILTYLL